VKHAQTAIEEKSRTTGAQPSRLLFFFAFGLIASETLALKSEKRFIPLP
jgi:hypothetical protein